MQEAMCKDLMSSNRTINKPSERQTWKAQRWDSKEKAPQNRGFGGCRRRIRTFTN
jgi:hypothetical protein